MGTKGKSQKNKDVKEKKKAPKSIEVVQTYENAFSAKVMEILSKIGTKQGGLQVRVKVLEGHDSGKIMRRNVLGPIRIGDILMLKETEIEAAPMKGKRGGGKKRRRKK